MAYLLTPSKELEELIDISVNPSQEYTEFIDLSVNPSVNPNYREYKELIDLSVKGKKSWARDLSVKYDEKKVSHSF